VLPIRLDPSPCRLIIPQGAINAVEVCVVSKGSAERLKKHFLGSKIEKLESGIPEPSSKGRPKEPIIQSGVDRRKRTNPIDSVPIACVMEG
jgi:hypothetical protein